MPRLIPNGSRPCQRTQQRQCKRSRLVDLLVADTAVNGGVVPKRQNGYNLAY